MIKKFQKDIAVAVIILLTVSPTLTWADFGQTTEQNLRQLAPLRFGIDNDIGNSAQMPVGFIRDKSRSADQLVKVANNLQVEFVTRNAAERSDQMTLYPATHPTHIIACIESKLDTLSNGKKNPSIQMTRLADGQVTTILRGMNRCDGIRLTPWGTILVTEEADDGQAYEIIDPLNTIENTLVSRQTGVIEGETANNIVKRDALTTKRWEGIAILDTGVIISGEELRPGAYSDATGRSDTDGGAIYKFIPETFFSGGQISDLTQSPLVAGKNYALQVSCFGDKIQFGQGCEVGNASWIEVSAANARIDANNNGATGFYRPEDLHRDPNYTGTGIRFCWTDTANEGASNYAELMCAIDNKPTEANMAELSVRINRFVIGNPDMNSFDNLDFQPGTGIHYIVEDHTNGDIWACLPDGKDRDILSDGCLKVISIVDATAEPTGFFFSDDGQTAYFTIQHSHDAEGLEVDGFATDDMIKISGFKTPSVVDKLDNLLNLSAGKATLKENNVIELKGFKFNGELSNAKIKINMDGTWSLQ